MYYLLIFLHYAFSWLPKLQDLSFLPVWVWAFILPVIYTGLIIFVPLPWWAWTIIGFISCALVFNTILYGMPGPQGYHR